MTKTERKCCWGAKAKCGAPARWVFGRWLCPHHVKALQRALGRMSLRERIKRGTVWMGE